MRAGWRTLVLALAAWGLAQGARAEPGDAPGLTAADRHVMVEALREGPVGPVDPNSDDTTLWDALRRHATAELGLRVNPRQVDSDWSIAPPPRQVDAEARAALEQGRLGAWLQGLEPAAPPYRALVAARARYAGIVARGGWTPIPDGPARRVGDTGLDIAALRARLAIEDGFDPAATEPELFDLLLRQALMAFQTRHGLTPDGRLNAGTRAELNVPAAQRLSQIDANLERWRWLPPLPAERVEVDIAAAEATLYRPGQPPLDMRVIVGDLRHKTPMFASRIDSVVFNPPWNVPASIAAHELLPKEAAHPGYLAANDFQFVEGALQQRPGPKNALGRLKFDFPSPYGVYLHDTPGRAAFARARRTLSHGCIRLEKPRELAAALLPPPTWTPESIDAAIDAGVTQRVASLPVPLFVLYWTAVVEPDGALQFRRDVYGWDARLTEALAAAMVRPQAALPRPATECSASERPQPVL